MSYQHCDRCDLGYNDEYCSTICPHKGIGFCAVCDCVVCVCTPETAGKRWVRSNANRDNRGETISNPTINDQQ